MGFHFNKTVLAVCAGIVLGTRLLVADTNPSTTPDLTNIVAAQNSLLQIQEQLRATQLAIEQNRETAEAEAKNIAGQLAALQTTFESQHAADAESARRTQLLTLVLIALFGVIGLGITLLMAYFQWRAFAQLAEIATRQTSTLPLASVSAVPEAVGQLAANGRAAVENSNLRLLGAVEKLEQRILQMERAARATLAEKNPAPEKISAHTNGNDNSKTQDTLDREECIANLFSEGESLLNAGEPEKALECFEVALRLFPQHAEALVKKGGALEKLGRLDEAITCYDQAIQSDNALTVAYLQKGGLFNRLARYEEALQCYERALQTQEKKGGVNFHGNGQN